MISNIRNVLTDSGMLVAIVQDGNGIDEAKSNLEVAQRKIRRTVYCYTKQQIQDAAEQFGLEYIRDGYLDSSILEYGWKSYIFGVKECKGA